MLRLLLDITATPNSNPDNMVWDNGLRSIVITFTVYHIKTNFHFYYTILYEFPDFASTPAPVININHFQPDLYSDTLGQTIYTYNIVRLVLSILIFILAVRVLRLQHKKLLAEESSISFFKLILGSRFILELTLCVIYWVTFGMKNIYLNDNRILDTKLASDTFLKLDYIEYFYVVYFSIIDSALETLLFLISSWRILMFFFSITRIKTFAFFVYSSFIKFMYLSIVLILILTAFTVTVNNQYGTRLDYFQTFSSSFIRVMLLSIGQINILLRPYYRWTF